MALIILNGYTFTIRGIMIHINDKVPADSVKCSVF